VRAALRDLPDEYAEALDNLEFVVLRVPSRRDRVRNNLGNAILYGFYEGTPLTRRTTGYGETVPDRISVFWGPLVRDFPDDGALEREVRNTVYHEIAHYFGLDEDDLHDTRVK
jgi:predicted Zn-dependent protease with MMP-like domain